MVIIQPDDPVYQERVIPALLRLKEKSPKGCPWTIDEVTEKLHTDEWLLLTFPDAFVVIEEDGEFLHAVIAAAFDGHTERFFEYTEMIGDVAKNAGYKGFSFTTCRRGWLKLAKEAGFKMREATFVYV